MHETLPQSAKFIYNLKSNFSKDAWRITCVYFKYMPEFADHDVMVKMFTFVVFNASEII